MIFGASAALAAEAMAPNDIKATFFTGQPFTAASPSGAKFKMTFTPDGKMTREPPLRWFILGLVVRYMPPPNHYDCDEADKYGDVEQ